MEARFTAREDRREGIETIKRGTRGRVDETRARNTKTSAFGYYFSDPLSYHSSLMMNTATC